MDVDIHGDVGLDIDVSVDMDVDVNVDIEVDVDVDMNLTSTSMLRSMFICTLTKKLTSTWTVFLTT